MPPLERVRVEVYIPDLPSDTYPNLLRSFEEEFTYAFGGCSIIRGLEGSYLSKTGTKVPDRVNLIFADFSLAVSTNFDQIARYTGELRAVSLEALSEESVLIARDPGLSCGLMCIVAAEQSACVAQNVWQRSLAKVERDRQSAPAER